MSPEIIAPVNPRTLCRIRELVGYAKPSDVGKVPGIPDATEKISRWEAGEPIKLKEAQKLAAKYRVAFPLLYLEQLPSIFNQPLPEDFRRGKQHKLYSPNLRFAIREAMFQQTWLRDYLKEVGQNRPVLSKQVNLDDDIAIVAEEIREWLKVSSDPVKNRASSITQTLENWQRIIDERNIMVLANKNNKEYRISEEEYNGLAMVDDIAPVILLNPVSSIRNKRRIFTLMHELAHLFLGESAVSTIDFHNNHINTQKERKERWCNKVASEILVPGKWLSSQWLPGQDAGAQIENIAKSIHVSRDMLAVKARSMELIKQEKLNNLLQTYREEYNQLRERVTESTDSLKATKKDPTEFVQSSFSELSHDHQSAKSLISVNTALKRCGHYFSRCVLDAYQSGIINATDIYDLTGGLQLKHLKEFAKKLDYPLHRWK